MFPVDADIPLVADKRPGAFCDAGERVRPGRRSRRLANSFRRRVTPRATL